MTEVALVSDDRPVPAPSGRSLRPYQETLRSNLVDYAARHIGQSPQQPEGTASTKRTPALNTALLVLPTGGGKTRILSETIITLVRDHNVRRVFWFTDRAELLNQTSAEMAAAGLDVGVLTARTKTAGGLAAHQVSVIMLPTAYRRLRGVQPHDFGDPEVVLFDEAHHMASASWSFIYDRYPNAFKIGATATPERLDNKGGKDLCEFYHHLVEGPGTEQLISEGYLTPPRSLCFEKQDLMQGVKRSGGDFKMADAWDKLKVDKEGAHVKDVVEEYAERIRSHINGPTIAYTTCVEHCEELAEHFNHKLGAGHAAALHSKMEPPPGVTDEKGKPLRGKSAEREWRAMLIQRLADPADDLEVLVNVNILTEGFDLPQLECIIFDRPTASRTVLTQQGGRGYRTYTNPDTGYVKERVYFMDMVGNFDRHNGEPGMLPEKQTRQGGGARPETGRICEECFTYHPRSPTASERAVKLFGGEVHPPDYPVGLDATVGERKCTHCGALMEEWIAVRTGGELVNYEGGWDVKRERQLERKQRKAGELAAVEFLDRFIAEKISVTGDSRDCVYIDSVKLQAGRTSEGAELVKFLNPALVRKALERAGLSRTGLKKCVWGHWSKYPSAAEKMKAEREQSARHESQEKTEAERRERIKEWDTAYGELLEPTGDPSDKVKPSELSRLLRLADRSLPELDKLDLEHLQNSHCSGVGADGALTGVRLAGWGADPGEAQLFWARWVAENYPKSPGMAFYKVKDTLGPQAARQGHQQARCLLLARARSLSPFQQSALKETYSQAGKPTGVPGLVNPDPWDCDWDHKQDRWIWLAWWDKAISNIAEKVVC